MSLKDKLTEDLKTAMKARDQVRLDAIRLLLSDLKNQAIAQMKGPHGDIDEAEELALLAKHKKQRDESITAFRAGGREDLASADEAQLQVILSYLPKQLTRDEVEVIARELVTEVGATSKKDMGKVMGKLMAKVKGRFPGDQVKSIVEGILP
ncbi:MAG: GatB/YqeY domain-containing protein [Myxococcota bacterium]